MRRFAFLADSGVPGEDIFRPSHYVSPPRRYFGPLTLVLRYEVPPTRVICTLAARAPSRLVTLMILCVESTTMPPALLTPKASLPPLGMVNLEPLAAPSAALSNQPLCDWADRPLVTVL